MRQLEQEKNQPFEVPCPVSPTGLRASRSRVSKEVRGNVASKTREAWTHTLQKRHVMGLPPPLQSGIDFVQEGLGVGNRFVEAIATPGPGDYSEDQCHGSVAWWCEGSQPTRQPVSKYGSAEAHCFSPTGLGSSGRRSLAAEKKALKKYATRLEQRRAQFGNTLGLQVEHLQKGCTRVWDADVSESITADSVNDESESNPL